MKNILQKIDKEMYLFIDEQVSRNENIERLFQQYKEENFNNLDEIKERVKSGEINHVIFAGMGSSMYALKETEEKFITNNLKVTTYEASTAAKYVENLIDENTLLVVVSQSGTSEEVVSLLAKVKDNNNIISITNNNESIMSNFKPMYEIFADSEYYIAHNSYLNTLLLLDWISNYLFEIPTDYTVNDVKELLSIQDEYIQSNWEEKLKIFGEIDALDIITEADNIGTGFNTALLFREGLGVMANTFSINEYYHGEHLVNNKNKLSVFTDVRPVKEDKNYMVKIEEVNNNEFLFINYESIYFGQDYDNYLKIKPVIQMAFFNRIVDYVMKEKR